MTMADQDMNTRGEAFVLPEELTIAQSRECYQALMSTIDGGGDVTLNASSVTRIDAAGIQMLFVIQRTLEEAGCTLNWHTASGALKSSAALMGMTEYLGLQE